MVGMLPILCYYSHNNIELKAITFLLLQTTIAKYLENLWRRIFSGHKLPALPSNIIWVGLSMNKQVNKCKKMSSETKKKIKAHTTKRKKEKKPTTHDPATLKCHYPKQSAELHWFPISLEIPIRLGIDACCKVLPAMAVWPEDGNKFKVSSVKSI